MKKTLICNEGEWAVFQKENPIFSGSVKPDKYPVVAVVKVRPNNSFWAASGILIYEDDFPAQRHLNCAALRKCLEEHGAARCLKLLDQCGCGAENA